MDRFRGLQYRLEPDYTKPVLELPRETVDRLRRRIQRLYGDDLVEQVFHEVARLMKVHHAYSTSQIEELELQVDPTQRFTHEDVVLITYGDLIVSDNRSPLHTLADFASVFFRGVVTTLHILPFHPYSSDRGFSVISYREVDPQLGTWQDIARLEGRFKLMFDGVFNHCSAKSEWFRRFLATDPEYREFFISFDSQEQVDQEALGKVLRPRTSDLLTEVASLEGRRYVWTTFSADQVDLNFKNPRVLTKVIATLLEYVRRGADIIRLDAVTYLWCELGTNCAHLMQTHEVVKLFRDVLDVVAPHVALITETNVPHQDNVSYFGDGSDEAQMVYNFALPPLVLHTFLTGDATALTSWAAEMDAPSATTCFFNFLDSHDGIGVLGAQGILSEAEIEAICRHVTATGGFVSEKTNEDGSTSPYELNTTWYSALNDRRDTEAEQLKIDRFIASRAIALMVAGVPGIYLPSMFGSRNDLDAVWREDSKRSINRSAMEEQALFMAFGDPGSASAQILDRYVHLLERRVAHPAFHPGCPHRILALDPRVFALVRSVGGEDPVLCLVNVTAGAAVLTLSLDELGLDGKGLVDLVSCETYHALSTPWRVTVKPYQVLWLKALESTAAR